MYKSFSDCSWCTLSESIIEIAISTNAAPSEHLFKFALQCKWNKSDFISYKLGQTITLWIQPRV